MAQPVRTRPAPAGKAFEVNDKPEVLDEMYNKLLGRGGDAMLPEEIKWLAVTHKSFDHGKRGSNDRLAFLGKAFPHCCLMSWGCGGQAVRLMAELGKRIVDLQSSLALLQMPQMRGSQSQGGHPALQGLENVSAFSKQKILAPGRIARLAQTYGLASVMRWKPRKVSLRLFGQYS